MSINPVWSLLISCLALAVSVSSLYFQHLRRTRKAFASVLWCRRDGDKVILEASISNQGNRPVTVSRVWLLSPRKGNTRVRYECESIHQAAPLKVLPMSGEFLRLPFVAPDNIKLHGLYPSLEPEPIIYDLLFYVTDDRGIEHYAEMPAVRVAANGGGVEVLRSSVRLVPGIKTSEGVGNAANAV